MADAQQKTLPPFSVRLTLEERARLNAEAGRMPLGMYVRERLLNSPNPRKRTFRQPVKDDQALAGLLSSLGQSRISSNLNQLAKASHSGSLTMTPETEKALLNACTDLKEMRRALMQALGLAST